MLCYRISWADAKGSPVSSLKLWQVTICKEQQHYTNCSGLCAGRWLSWTCRGWWSATNSLCCLMGWRGHTRLTMPRLSGTRLCCRMHGLEGPV